MRNPQAAFQLLGALDTVDKFFEHVADDVKWTMVGLHPLAGEYHNKRDFLGGTLEQVRSRSGGLGFDLKQLYGTDSEVVVVMEGVATAGDGEPDDPFYVWLCRFEDDVIVEVQTYVDTRVATGIVDRVPGARTAEPQLSAEDQAEARRTRVPVPLHRP